MSTAHSEMYRIDDKKEIQAMMDIWPDIVRDITEEAKDLNLPDVATWMEEMLHYTVPHGKKTRSLILIHAYKMLVPKDQLTEENLRLVRILGWCFEMMIAGLLIIDDITDQSKIRRGQLCWYLYNDIGEPATNDGKLVVNASFYILQKYFKDKDYYVNLLHAFQEDTFKTILGQCCDVFSTNFHQRPNLSLFTINRYDSILKYKTIPTLPLLSIRMAIHMAGIKDPEVFKRAEPILSEIGHLFQVENDYLGFLGDYEGHDTDNNSDNGDIRVGKCSWFIVIALQHATPEQRKILEECYGDLDPEKVKCVKQVYTDLDMSNIFSSYEKKTYNRLITNVEKISYGFPRDIFVHALEHIYCRF